MAAADSLDGGKLTELSDEVTGKLTNRTTKDRRGVSQWAGSASLSPIRYANMARRLITPPFVYRFQTGGISGSAMSA